MLKSPPPPNANAMPVVGKEPGSGLKTFSTEVKPSEKNIVSPGQGRPGQDGKLPAAELKTSLLNDKPSEIKIAFPRKGSDGVESDSLLDDEKEVSLSQLTDNTGCSIWKQSSTTGNILGSGLK